MDGTVFAFVIVASSLGELNPSCFRAQTHRRVWERCSRNIVHVEMQIARESTVFHRWPRDIWLVFCVGVCLLWVFLPTLRTIADRWTKDVEYSHGYLVPIFSAYLLWSRRGLINSQDVQPSWWGLAILAAGLVMRFVGTYTFFDWLSAAALIPCLAGLFVLACGWPGLQWAWPALVFLLFMIPLPYRFEVSLAQPLQRAATVTSTYTLQTLGFIAFAEGNVIRLGPIRIGVVEACSGLSMLLIFFALSTAVVMVVLRPWPEKVVILLSALPVALFANVVRITATAILHKTAGPKLADLVFHDLAGWLMMPLALALLWAELILMSWILVPTANNRRGTVQNARHNEKLGRHSTRTISKAKSQ
jgi:exosortase